MTIKSVSSKNYRSNKLAAKEGGSYLEIQYENGRKRPQDNVHDVLKYMMTSFRDTDDMVKVKIKNHHGKLVTIADKEAGFVPWAKNKTPRQ